MRCGWQVHCLRQLRTLEATGEAPAEYKDYMPEDDEVPMCSPHPFSFRGDSWLKHPSPPA